MIKIENDLLSPQLQVYNAIFSICQDLGYNTYDYLPANEVKYPFIYVGEQFNIDRLLKGSLYGDVQQVIHLYHNYKKRREIADMKAKIKQKCWNLKKTDNFYVNVRGVQSRLLIDNSTPDTLLHGIIEVDITFN